MKKIFTFFAFVLLSIQLTYGQETSIPFITTWTLGANDKFTLNIDPAFEYVYSYRFLNIQGELIKSGNVDSNSTLNPSNDLSLTVTEAGTYTLLIEGTFPRLLMLLNADHLKLNDVKQWGTIEWKSMKQSFRNYTGSGFTAVDTPDLSGCTNFDSMFNGSNFNQDISKWNMGAALTMRTMFSLCPFNQNINDWNVSSVTDMFGMFSTNASFNKPLFKWDVSNVTNMEGMFNGATSFNQNINNWKVINVTNMNRMFRFATAYNVVLFNWEVDKVTTMSNMFEGSAFDQDISTWNVVKVATMENMFLDGNLSGQNFDKMLMAWSDLPVLQNNVKLGVGSTTFCKGDAARTKLQTQKSWVISNGNKSCSTATDILVLEFTGVAIADGDIDTNEHTVAVEVSNAQKIDELLLFVVLSLGATSTSNNGENLSFTETGSGIYTATITVTAEDGNTTQEWTVTVTQGPALGLPQQDLIELTVYPNPFEEVLYIKSEKPFSVSLSNMNGIRLHQEKSEGDLQLNLAGLSSGMYLLVIENEDGVSTKKVVKK